jgi:hypothetical protein
MRASAAALGKQAQQQQQQQQHIGAGVHIGAGISRAQRSASHLGRALGIGWREAFPKQLTTEVMGVAVLIP